jgi:SNF2 family DNA or RNA helicase
MMGIEVILDEKKDRVVFVGNTFEHRELIKSTGAKWDFENKFWYHYFDRITLEVIQDMFKNIGIVFDPKLQTILERREKYRNDMVANLKLPLYPYQIEGVKFLLDRERAILADDVGLGKTVQAICSCLTLNETNGLKKVLVFCPASLKFQWAKEINKFSEGITIRIIDGTPKERDEIYSEEAMFYIINYELIHRDYEKLLALKPDAIILDEATKVKNRKSQTNKLIKKLMKEGEVKYRYILTGTPIENHLEELYAIVSLLDSRIFGHWKYFEQEYILYNLLYLNHLPYPIKTIKGYKNLDKIKVLIKKIMFRRKKTDVLKDLPDVNEQLRVIDWEIEHKKIYKAYKDKVKSMIALHEEMNPGRIDASVLAEVNMLRMLSDSTELVMMSESKMAEVLKITKPISSKMEELVELLEELEGHKVVIFTQYVKMLQIIKRDLKRKYDIEVIHGGVPAKERQEVIDRFSTDPDKNILVMTDAGTYGLNIQAADCVVNFDLPWNPAKLQQRIGRCHRLGQKNQVNVFNFVLKNSIDENVLNTLYRKKHIFDNVIEQEEGDVIIFNKLNYSELKELLV